jgi:hypothetical protein
MIIKWYSIINLLKFVKYFGSICKYFNLFECKPMLIKLLIDSMHIIDKSSILFFIFNDKFFMGL